MPFDKKYLTIIVLVASLLVLGVYLKPQSKIVENNNALPLEVSEPTGAVVSKTDSVPADVKVESRRKKSKSPEKLAKQAAKKDVEDERRQAKKEANKAARLAKSGNKESEFEKQERKAERQLNKRNKRMQSKAWWNKGGGKKTTGLELSDEQKSEMDTKLLALLDSRQQLGQQLQPLWASNRDALANGDRDLIASNLERMERLQAQWQQERRNAIMDILNSLDEQQLAALADSGGGIADMNWLDYDLGKNIDRGEKQQKNNRRRKPEN